MSQTKQKLSQLVWGLDWKEHLPAQFHCEYLLESINYEDFLKIKESPNNFLVTSENTNDTFLKDLGSKVKENYLQNVCEYFAVTLNGEIVAVGIGELQDWATFYARFFIAKKEHRSQNFLILYMSQLEKVLRQYNVDKITCDISPSNVRQIMRLSHLGYVCTGNNLSERFGANVRLTKFLSEKAWQVFGQSFTQSYYKNTKTSGSNEASRQPIMEYV